MRESSRATVFLNTRKPEQRYKMLKFNVCGQADGFCLTIFEKYEMRRLEHEVYNFKDMSLIEFAMRFQTYYIKTLDEEIILPIKLSSY